MARKALYFDGTDDKVEATSAFGDINFKNQAFTIEFWAKLTAANGTLVQLDVATGTNFGLTVNYYHTINQELWVVFNRTDLNATGRIAIKTDDISAFITITDWNWFHITYDGNGTPSTSTVLIYINNVNRTLDTGAASPSYAQSNTIRLGENGGGSYDFAGTIDEVRISDIVRSEADRDVAWNGGVGCELVSDDNTIWLVHLNDETSPTEDSSSNGNDGTVTGASWVLGFPLRLTTTLKTAQEASSIVPAPKVVFSKAGETDITYETERILSLEHSEIETSHKAVIELQNADGTLKDLSFKGWTATISHGLNVSGTKHHSACAPLTVLSQKPISGTGFQRHIIQCIGIPDKLKEDKSDGDYFHHKSSTKTVKDLITEIADGQPVSETLTESQELTTGGGYFSMYTGANIVVGQILDIDATVSSLSFKLKKTGSPTGNISFVLYDITQDNEVDTKVLANASTLTTSPAWYKVTWDSANAIDSQFLIYVLFDGGDASNTVDVQYAQNVVNNQVAATAEADPADGYDDYHDRDLVYRFEYSYAGIEVFDHCTAYTVTYDSEDSLIDVYLPADSFIIKEGEDRLSKIDELLYHTGCYRRFEDDGEIHVFVPTTTGTTYNSEYSLSTGHPFFSKAIRDDLVVPNKIVVRNSRNATTAYEGSATSAASYALLPITDFRRTAITSAAQGNSVAAAMISRLEIHAQQGAASIPINCGSVLYDYVKVNEFNSDLDNSKTGNLGAITRIFKNYPNRPTQYYMSFSFGRVALKSVPGTKLSSLNTSDILTRDGDTGESIPNAGLWSNLMGVLIPDIASVIDAHSAMLGYNDDEDTTNEQINESLLTYYTKTQIDALLVLTNSHTIHWSNGADLTSARAFAGNYQNDSGGLRLVTAVFSMDDAESIYIYVESGDATPDVDVYHLYNNNASNASIPITFPVARDSYYKIAIDAGTPAILDWSENDVTIG